MNRDDIIRMAREAGIECVMVRPEDMVLYRFATLVAAAEREQIAKMIEDAPKLHESVSSNDGTCLICGFSPKFAAASIRARGQNDGH